MLITDTFIEVDSPNHRGWKSPMKKRTGGKRNGTKGTSETSRSRQGEIDTYELSRCGSSVGFDILVQRSTTNDIVHRIRVYVVQLQLGFRTSGKCGVVC